MTQKKNSQEIPEQGEKKEVINEQTKEAAEKAAAEKEAVEKEAVEKNIVDAADYDKYCELKFMELDGAKLKDESKKTLASLEEKLKASIGPKPKMTVTASIGMERVRLVKDIPVPASVLKIVGDKKEYYF